MTSEPAAWLFWAVVLGPGYSGPGTGYVGRGEDPGCLGQGCGAGHTYNTGKGTGRLGLGGWVLGAENLNFAILVSCFLGIYLRSCTSCPRDAK